MKIKTFIINLEKRTDRKAHILNEFIGRSDFIVNVVPAIEDIKGSRGLWSTISEIVRNRIEERDDLILLVEDDHQFTVHYDPEEFLSYIRMADEMQVDVLLGGISWFDDAIQLSESLFHLNTFNATQFVILYRRFFDRLKEGLDTSKDTADINFSKLAKKKAVIYPFISHQVEFGYSDATPTNSEEGYVSQLFVHSEKRIGTIKKVMQHFKQLFHENKRS